MLREMENNRFQHPFFETAFFQNRIFAHLAFWVAYVGFQAFFTYTDNGVLFTPFEALLVELLLITPKLLSVYFTLYFLIPRYFLKGVYWLFAIGVFFILMASGILNRVLVMFVFYPIKFPDLPLESFWKFSRVIEYGLDILGVLLLASIIKIFKYWYEEQQNARSMIQEKLEAELKFLKGQIHPHFLFNTLNNLYALTLKKSDDAPEVVLRLSGMMDYMLYDASAPYVVLEQEIESLHNYISLERIRYGKELDIRFEVEGDISQVKIAPLLLQPFVENSFKHGVSESIEEKWIHIDVKVIEGVLYFKVENSKIPEEKKDDAKRVSGGIGLKNVRRRLQLLYQGQYTLDTEEKSRSFEVNLRLPLLGIMEEKAGIQ
ncbi:MAG: histidine kinase [Bacteroidia bacterium]|nr:histidine kinase [Bacteroidia bacterium]